MPSLPEIGSSLPDVALRTALVYVFLVVAIRISGKREVGQMSVLEFIVILIISDAVQNSMVGDNISVWGGMVAVSTLLILDFALRTVADRWPRFGKTIKGEPRLLIRDGLVIEKAVREEGLTTDDLELALRNHGVERIDQVSLAVLETNGSISVVPRESGGGGGGGGSGGGGGQAAAG